MCRETYKTHIITRTTPPTITNEYEIIMISYLIRRKKHVNRNNEIRAIYQNVSIKMVAACSALFFNLFVFFLYFNDMGY